MDLENFKQKLKSYTFRDIIIKKHAKEQAEIRQINVKDVIDNILHPDKLVFVERQEAKHIMEQKYNCYFAYSDNYYHRYIIVLNGKLLIVTIIGINRNWQRAVEGVK